jgi:hypothetical protein
VHSVELFVIHTLQAPAVLGPSTGKAPAAVPPMGMKASPKPVLRQPVTPGTKREAGNLSTLSPEGTLLCVIPGRTGGWGWGSCVLVRASHT